MCLNPKWIYKKGKYKEDNYRGQAGDFYELGTYSKCGSCTVCLAERANNWVIRNHYESKVHKRKCFITLTYAENPIFIVRKDFQDFMKRLRYYINQEEKNTKVRCFYAGEYGERHGRSHFHVIIYGWDDKNAKLLTVNKKKNIIYQSELIQKAWGLGRTSYQSFDDNEIPYIALYNTAQETFKKAYKMTLEKCRALQRKADDMIKHVTQRKNLLEELKEMEKILAETKEKYILIKEFNGWSVALGWEEFEKQYNMASKYAFQEYIGGNQFVTPTPWVKKLANMGDWQAAQEMFRREEELEKSKTEEEEIRKNQNRVERKRKKELLEWAEVRKNTDTGL